jgi:hypothetical protein
MMRIVQRELHEQLRDEATSTREKLASLLRPINPAELNEHPEQDGWSIGQVLEHLCVADERYERPLADMLRSVRPDAGALAREWKSSFIGGMIASSLLKPRKLKSPVVFWPGPTPRNGIVETFLAREINFMKAMDDASSYDWKANRIGSPALPGWAPKMNLGDGFRIHVIHLTRHAGQVERLAGKL